MKVKTFEQGQLVRKTILFLGSKNKEYKKWTVKCEGLFKVYKMLKRNAYYLADLEGNPHQHFINGKYLKACYPSLLETIGFILLFQFLFLVICFQFNKSDKVLIG